jgi:hypothetical protein
MQEAGECGAGAADVRSTPIRCNVLRHLFWDATVALLPEPTPGPRTRAPSLRDHYEEAARNEPNLRAPLQGGVPCPSRQKGLICREKGGQVTREAPLAMQKLKGTSPFSRSQKSPARQVGCSNSRTRARQRGGRHGSSTGSRSCRANPSKLNGPNPRIEMAFREASDSRWDHCHLQPSSGYSRRVRSAPGSRPPS